MADITLDKDNLVSATITLAESPLQISVLRESIWSDQTRLYVQQETTAGGTFKDVAGTAMVKEEIYSFSLKPGNYRISLDQYRATDVVSMIVT